MRKSVVLACLVALVTIWPVSAQQAPTEQTILDATIVMHPPSGDALCMQIGAGQLTVTTQVVSGSVDTPSPQPNFDLNGYMADPNVMLAMRVNANEAASTVQLAGAMYCWRLWVDPRTLPPNAAQMSNAERGAFIQQVHLRMTLTPADH